ncbi:50S ribosomal protein L27 [Patescibacteria group bacterium]
MAHKKAGGSADNVHDSQSQRLGVKIFGGQKVVAGNIIVRQRGTRYRSGEGTKLGKDHTIFATIGGKVAFQKKKIQRFTGSLVQRTYVSIVPEEASTKK